MFNKSHLEMLAVGEGRGHSRSSEMARFDGSYATSFSGTTCLPFAIHNHIGVNASYLIHDLLFLPISTIVWSELTCRNSLSHSRLACSRLSAHIQPSVNNPDTNGAAKQLLNTTRQYNYNGHELS